MAQPKGSGQISGASPSEAATGSDVNSGVVALHSWYTNRWEQVR